MDEGTGQHNVANTVTDNLVAVIFGSTAINGKLYLSSDRRIKKDISATDNCADLSKINELVVSNYKYIDTLEYGSKQQKKLIAQQVKSVYPDAVTSRVGFVPNIFAQSVSANKEGALLKVTLTDSKDIKVGDKIRFYTDSAVHEEKILSVSDNTFTVAYSGKQPGKKVFVYGTEVSDFLSVDYDAISMLNVSATQELSKQLADAQAQIKQLKAEKEQMKNTLDEIKTSKADASEVTDLKAQLKEINERLHMISKQ
jgi:hypothetical protein